MADIFISYARSDRDRIEKLAKALETDGYSVWWDRHIAGGAEFSKKIERELLAAKTVIVAWSISAIESMWVADEATLGRDHHKLLPIALDPVPPPIGFRQVQTVDFQAWSGHCGDEAYKALTRAIGRDGMPQEENADAATPAPPTQSRDGVSLVVLPFRTISADPADQVLSIALHEDLTTQLARVKDYFVIARTTAAVLEADKKSPKEIGREIGVTYVLEGSVRRGGDDIRVNANLIDAVTGGHIAALSFDRPASELLDLQNDLIAEIVNHLGSEINLAEVRQFEARACANPTALESFKFAKVALAQKGWNKKGVSSAIMHLKQAMEEDPEYAPAISQLALLKGLASVHQVLDENFETIRPEVTELARRAIALDWQSSDVLGNAGCALCDVGEIEEGAALLERAVEIDPSNAQAFAAFGWARILQGRPEEGVPMMSAAIRISPRQPGLAFWLFGMATGFHQLGETASAIAALERAIRFDPTFAISYVLLAEIVEGEGDASRAAQLRARGNKARTEMDAQMADDA